MVSCYCILPQIVLHVCSLKLICEITLNLNSLLFGLAGLVHKHLVLCKAWLQKLECDNSDNIHPTSHVIGHATEKSNLDVLNIIDRGVLCGRLNMS